MKVILYLVLCLAAQADYFRIKITDKLLSALLTMLLPSVSSLLSFKVCDVATNNITVLRKTELFMVYLFTKQKI